MVWGDLWVNIHLLKTQSKCHGLLHFLAVSLMTNRCTVSWQPLSPRATNNQYVFVEKLRLLVFVFTFFSCVYSRSQWKDILFSFNCGYSCGNNLNSVSCNIRSYIWHAFFKGHKLFQPVPYLFDWRNNFVFHLHFILPKTKI